MWQGVSSYKLKKEHPPNPRIFPKDFSEIVYLLLSQESRISKMKICCGKVGIKLF